jgi:hypothetical protein
LVRPFGVDTTRPGGRLSVKAMLVFATVVLKFVMVKVGEVRRLSGSVAARDEVNLFWAA